MTEFYPLESDEKIVSLMEKLHPWYHDIYVLYYLTGTGASCRDIAKALNMSEGTVKSRLSRARDFIRRHRLYAIKEI